MRAVLRLDRARRDAFDGLCGKTLTCLSLQSQHAGLPIDKNYEQMEINKRRIDFAAEVGADCFMFMGAGKPSERPIDDSDLAKLADVSEEWADYASRYALDVCYHIHTNTTSGFH